MKLRALILAGILTLAPLRADDQDQPLTLRMPNDCVILALQAYARTKDVCPWSALLLVHFEGAAQGHALCLFQFIDGSLWSYDAGGSLKLDTRDRSNLVILIESVSRAYGEKIDRATFIHR